MTKDLHEIIDSKLGVETAAYRHYGKRLLTPDAKMSKLDRDVLEDRRAETWDRIEHLIELKSKCMTAEALKNIAKHLGPVIQVEEQK